MWFWNKNKKNKGLETGIFETSNQRFNIQDIMIIDYLADAILVFDANNRLFLANLQAEKFLKVKRENLIGKTILEVNKFLNFEDLTLFFKAGTKNKKAVKKELKLKENLIAEATIIPIISEEKKEGVLLILRDITREKLIEKIKNEFIRLSTHQLWTPISAVKWSLQMLLRGEMGDLNEEQKNFIRKIYETNDREIKLIGDLSNAARIEMGDFLSNLVLFDIGELIQSVVNNYKEKAKIKGIEIEFKKPKEQLPKVMIDVKEMKTAIRNIIDNAVRYTFSPGKIKISLEKNKKEIEIQIADNGMGIPQNEQKKVFTKFFRASNITQIDTEGTGLGLYIAKNIIEAHGGKIWFESEKNKGTTFYFTIPIRKQFGEFITGRFY